MAKLFCSQFLRYAATITIVVAALYVFSGFSNSAFAGIEEAVTQDVVESAKDLGDSYKAGEYEKEKSAGLPQFDPSSYPTQIFWLFAFFAFLYIFFSKKTLPEISSVLENRREHIESYTQDAEDLRNKAEETQRIYEDGLESARKESAQITFDLHEEIKEKSQHKNDFFLEKSKHEINELEKRIEEAKVSAFKDMNQIAAEIASAATEKIVGIDMDLKTAAEVVESITNKDMKKKAA